ncbi:DUF2288 domain-containing protein [Methylosoma difficile]
MHTNPDDLAKAKLNLETSQMPWSALQRFFAAGSLVFVDARLDLVDVAYQFSIDNKNQVEQWLAQGLVHLVTDGQAQQWLAGEALLWTTVVKPWVLVQA